MKILTNSSSETKKLGEKLAKEILSCSQKKDAFVIGLIGDLGGGKTTFLQGLAKGLGIKDKINSPTFVIMKRYKNFYHFDCYRIKDPKEILNLGFKEIISNPQNIVALEWADQIQDILPKHALIIEFDFIAQNTRRVKIKQWNKKKRNGLSLLTATL
ncbi:tRNA (adenosine(37)-N6)-threonylcarbamoyltransferase complex ATPase subunit type 1 TsaE [Candidatus Parcubacteria bacterium]|nr:tRNA (adenosine(37)-N6)-threonylcarbamoyltransferase complex ATPase subunit type 1 TsaE [Candidatus Parcubacteria bacterium]